MIQKSDTKIMLKESIMDIMKKKPLEKITIRDITANCSMRRESFYYHFADKYELLQWIYEDEVYDKLVSDFEGPGSWEYIVKRCLDYIEFYKCNSNFIREALKDTNQNGFHTSLVSCTSRITAEHVKYYLRTDKLTQEMDYYIKYYANANVGLCEEWILKGHPVSEVFIAEIMTNSMPLDLRKVYFVD